MGESTSKGMGGNRQATTEIVKIMAVCQTTFLTIFFLKNIFNNFNNEGEI